MRKILWLAMSAALILVVIRTLGGIFVGHQIMEEDAAAEGGGRREGESSPRGALAVQRTLGRASVLEKADNREVVERYFPHSKVIAALEQSEDSGKTQTRIEILETDFHYPLVRRLTRRTWDASGNRIEGQEFAVADHVNVQKPEGISEEEFVALIKRSAAWILKHIADTSFYTIAFDGRDPNALSQVMERLKKEGLAQVEPDYIRFSH